METPGNLKKDAYRLLDQAQEIVAQAIGEKRSLTATETAVIASLRGEGEPMLLRAKEIQMQLARTGVE
jgi:hypothetical protein